jgi:hypothetical protein
MDGLTWGDDRDEGKVKQFDLTLERPGQWTLEGGTIPYGLWYKLQRDAMSYAEFDASDCETMIVRLHNRWKGPQ